MISVKLKINVLKTCTFWGVKNYRQNLSKNIFYESPFRYFFLKKKFLVTFFINHATRKKF